MKLILSPFNCEKVVSCIIAQLITSARRCVQLEFEVEPSSRKYGKRTARTSLSYYRGNGLVIGKLTQSCASWKIENSFVK
jgi:hypothetical protein